MDWLTFITKIVASLAWPLVTLTFLYWLRPYFGSLVRRLDELSLPGGTKAKFTKELENAQQVVSEIYDHKGFPIQPLLINSSEFEVGEGAETKYLQLAASFPEAAILQSYQDIERIIIQHSDLLEKTRRFKPVDVIHSLYVKEAIDSRTVDLFNRLRKLRNTAAHAGTSNGLSFGEAVEYRALCRLFADTLTEAFKKLEGNTQLPTPTGNKK